MKLHRSLGRNNARKVDGRSFLPSIALLLVVFIVGTTYMVRYDYTRTMTDARNQLASVSELFEQSLDSKFAIANVQMWNLIKLYASRPSIAIEDVEARYGDLMRQTLQQIDQIDSLLLLDTDGTVTWASVPQMAGMQLADRRYFQTALELGLNEYAVGVPIYSSRTGRRLTPIAWPVVSPSGEVLGVIASSLSETYFSDALTLEDIPEDMHVEILAANGAPVFESQELAQEAGKKEIVESRKISTLGLTINVTRSHNSVLLPYYKRTLGFLLIATTLFVKSISMAMKLNAKSIQLSSSLKQSRETNHKLLAAQREFNAIFDSVGEGIVIFSKDGKFNRTNKIARELLSQQDNDLAIEQLRAMLPDFSKIPKELHVHRCTTPDGRAIKCRMMKLTSNNQDVAYCVLANATDEERLAAARDSFVTSVNHELRTPLTSLSGSLNLLENRFSDGIPDPAKRLIVLASRNAERLLMLVNDILTLQAIDQGQFNLRTRPVMASDALEEAVASNSGYGFNAQVNLACERSEEAIINADPDRLQQIFSNLISNAIKYSPPGSTVNIGAVQNGDALTFYVRDNGPGIPSVARERLFDRFALPVHDGDVQVSGTGLGLAITKQLVERQDGNISFDTQTAVDDTGSTGTVFFVTFPCHIAHTAPPEEDT
ncbi:MAG: ATP-binding protein [Sulfitobacter sp.]